MDAQTLNQLYNEQGMSLQDIGDIYNVSKPTVSKALREYDIPVRTRSQARLLALSKGKLPNQHTFNREFFNKWSPQMAYVLGLVYADGTVQQLPTNNSLRLGWGEDSKQLVYNVLHLMGSNKDPTQVDNHGYPFWYITFSSKDMCNRLNELGVPAGKKSHILQWPDNIPPRCIPDFIRGYWEGDGTVNDIYLGLSSGSKVLLEGIQVVLDIGGYIKLIPGSARLFPNGKVYMSQDSYVLHYYSQIDKQCIYDYMYYPCLDEHMVLNSKRDKCIRILGL